MKRWIGLLIIGLLLFSNIAVSQEEVSSGFDEEKSYSWLKQNVGNFGNIKEISTISFVMLALINHGDDVSNGVSRLNSLRDSTYCWPRNECKVSDTALATLAMAKAGENVDNSINWLEDKTGALNAALNKDKWFIDIIGDESSSGECTLTYKGGNTAKVTLDKGVIKSISKGVIDSSTGKIKVSSLLDLSKVSENMNIDCSDIPGSVKVIQLTYEPQTTNRYTLINERVSILNLTVDNGCYGTLLTSSGCDYLSTAYTSWALDELNRKILTKAYLESQVSPNDVLENAIVGRITGKSNYIDFLVNNQKSDGSWEGNVYKTAWSLFALSKSPTAEYDSGLEYLRNIVSDKGHWNNNPKDSAMALIALHGKDLSGASVVISDVACYSDLDCLTGTCNLDTNLCESISGDVEICDNFEDDDADGFYDCDDEDCVSDSACVGEDECTIDEDCVLEYGSDYYCDSGTCLFSGGGCNEDGFCDSGEGCTCSDCEEKPQCLDIECSSDKDCADDEKCDLDTNECIEKGKFPWLVLIIILLLIVLGGGGFYLFKLGKLDNLKDLFKKKPKSQKPSFSQYTKERPIMQETYPQQKPKPEIYKKTKEDIELEKSLREAEKILHGK